MYTIDAQCPRCIKKDSCPARPEIIRTLTTLTNKLNTEEPFISGPGDGVLIISCNDYAVA